MHSDPTTAVLNRLWVIHQYSLAGYLACAPPCWEEKDLAAASLLRSVAAEQADLANRISKLIVDGRGNVSISRFPERFLGMHDLSADYTWKELICYQQRIVEAITALLPELPPGTKAEAIAHECLGVAKAHLDSMQELPT